MLLLTPSEKRLLLQTFLKSFRGIKAREEKKKKKKLNFNSSNSEQYDKVFTFKELKSALNKAYDSSFGQDKVHY